MTEAHGVSITAISKDCLPVTCKGCGEILGSIVAVKGRPMLAINSKVPVFVLDGICDRCGSQVHWRSGDILFARLMERIHRRKKLCVEI